MSIREQELEAENQRLKDEISYLKTLLQEALAYKGIDLTTLQTHIKEKSTPPYKETKVPLSEYHKTSTFTNDNLISKYETERPPNVKSEYDRLQEINDKLYQKLIPSEPPLRNFREKEPLISSRNYTSVPPTTHKENMRYELDELRQYLDRKYEERGLYSKSSAYMGPRDIENTQPLRTISLKDPDIAEMTLTKLHTGTKNFYDEFFAGGTEEKLGKDKWQDTHNQIEQVKRNIREKLAQTGSRPSNNIPQPIKVRVSRSATKTTMQNYKDFSKMRENKTPYVTIQGPNKVNAKAARNKRAVSVGMKKRGSQKRKCPQCIELLSKGFSTANCPCHQ